MKTWNEIVEADREIGERLEGLGRIIQRQPYWNAKSVRELRHFAQSLLQVVAQAESNVRERNAYGLAQVTA